MRLTKEQREWVDWALGSIDDSTNSEPDQLAYDQDCTVEHASALIAAADAMRLDGDTLTLPPPSPAADETVSDLGYWLATKASDLCDDMPAFDGCSKQKAAGSRRAALAAWEKIKATYEASGGKTIDAIVYCTGWERPVG